LQLDLSTTEIAELDRIKSDQRQCQWLASRQLIHLLLGNKARIPLEKDTYGKPFLPNIPQHISISHSGQFAASLIAPVLCGIDIQKIGTQIKRIQHKFMSPEALLTLDQAYYLEHLHIYWGAKEAMYKAYGRKQLSFIPDMRLEPFSYDLAHGQTIGYVLKNGVKQQFDLHYEKLDDYMLVTAFLS
ncbi:MAG: 4'-phosphopantetheinyl transferase superfamily protein, partial [Bacteroidota bacterium]